MTLLRPPSGWAIRLSMMGAAAFSVVAPAFADKPVQMSFKEAPGYARITAKWGDGDETAPKISAQISNQVLILTFDQKVSINLDKMKEGLPNWAAVTFMDPDGMTARIGLKQAPKLAVSTSVDLTAIDLIPESSTTAPPKLVSPLAAVKAKEAEAKRVAALPHAPAIEPLEVRGSHSGDSSRVAFYWPAKTGYKVVSQSDGVLKLQFAKRAKPDLAYLRISPPANLGDFQGENTDRGYVATITSKDKLPIKHFLEGDVLVVDITKPLSPEAQAAAKAAEAAAKNQPKPQKVADKSSLLTPPKLESATAIDEPAAGAPPPPSATLGGPERVTAMSPNWRDSAPRSGLVNVKATPIPSGLELQVPFTAPTPAAVFARGSAVWAVFAANADLKIDATQLPAGYRTRTMRVKNATLMRIETPKGLIVSADMDESVWTLRFAPTGTKPQRFLAPQRKPGEGGRARIETMLIGAAGLIWFEDPVIGDQVAVAVSYGPSSASPTPRDFVEASLPATAHGLAIAPKSDDVLVTIEGERVVVTMASGVQSAPADFVADTGLNKIAANPAFVDFAGWGASRGEAYFDQLAGLESAAASVDPSTPQGGNAALDLVRFHIGHDHGFEALGVLKVAVADRPELEQDTTFIGLRGVANYMADRLKAADDDLARGSLRGDPSASLWRAMIATQRGEYERAIEFFRASDKQIFSYPSSRAAVFAASWAEAAMRTNDYDAARRQANTAITNGDRETKERGQLVLATLRSVIEGPAAAYDDFKRLSETASEPIAVRAELKRLELGVQANKMTAAEAATELESLRFRWRGDEVEMATVGILADQYMRVGRFRDALLLAQSTALRDATAPGARELRIKLADYFRRLFLNGEADRLDPIQSVALFYEFDDNLMPIGPDGDQMVRKLAQRLVAFDLLEPASVLLQYQVDNRIRGIGKAAVAVDLATIYLWDKRPDKALAAINTTRQPQLPKQLALERRLLEAAAYRDMGRYDHVIELVEPLDGVEAKSLLADAYWRDRKWPDAAKALIAMLPQPSQVSLKDADTVFKAAIAARMAKDAGAIMQIRGYAAALANNPNKASFDLITSQADVSGAALSEAVRRLADAPKVDAFAAAMKQRFEAPKVTPGATPAAAPAATPAAPAAPATTAAATPTTTSGGSR